MKRSKPLRRSGPIRKHRPKRRDREDPIDALYREWVHTQPCVWLEINSDHHCSDRSGFHLNAPVEQSHIRFNTGMGQKPPERQSLPMCGYIHGCWEERRGPFGGMSQLERWAWAKPLLGEHWDRFQVWVKAWANRVIAWELRRGRLQDGGA